MSNASTHVTSFRSRAMSNQCHLMDMSMCKLKATAAPRATQVLSAWVPDGSPLRRRGPYPYTLWSCHGLMGCWPMGSFLKLYEPLWHQSMSDCASWNHPNKFIADFLHLSSHSSHSSGLVQLVQLVSQVLSTKKKKKGKTYFLVS